MGFRSLYFEARRFIYMTLTEEKILNGIKYFVTHTKNVGRTKLFKLLYFWDFIHFKRYGMSVTGYDYYTYPFGPVPKELYDEIDRNELPVFLKNNIVIIEDETEDTDDFKKFKILLKNKKIDYDCLSPNERSILEEVAFEYKDASAKMMTEITHLRNSPWDQTRQKGMFKPIDYFLAIDEETQLDREEIEERFLLQKELMADGRH
jgi:uncharacterized phage-associated protein